MKALPEASKPTPPAWTKQLPGLGVILLIFLVIVLAVALAIMAVAAAFVGIGYAIAKTFPLSLLESTLVAVSSVLCIAVIVGVFHLSTIAEETRSCRWILEKWWTHEDAFFEDEDEDYPYDEEGEDYPFDEEEEEEPPQLRIPEPVVKEERTPRNAPCPCGSGRKYKNCCGKNK